MVGRWCVGLGIWGGPDWATRAALSYRLRPAVELASNNQTKSISPVSAEHVRYIKLGERGRWEAVSERTQTIRIGFNSERPDRFALCMAGDWTGVAESFRAQGKAKGTATRIANELRLFFEDSGSTLWITFMGERLCWGFTDGGVPERQAPNEGVTRHIRGGWRDRDLLGEPLVKDRLSGALTKLAGYRGTSCRVDVRDYVVRRINGERSSEIERALAARTELQQATLPLIRQLGDRDFELLVDLIFSASGWRRIGIVGGTQKTKDISLQLPSTGEQAFIQVKSTTTPGDMAAYAATLDERGPFDRMFFVYHTSATELSSDDDRVVVIGPKKLAEMVIDAGLVGWIIEKVS
jgi:hypothetical protein